MNNCSESSTNLEPHWRSLIHRTAQAELYSRSLSAFVKAGWPQVEGSRPLKWNWHLDLLCKSLMDVERGVYRRLIFNLPPRATKSTVASVMLPCWLWTRKPSLTFMFASYAWGLSQDHAYKRRAILESDWYRQLFGDRVTLSTDRNNIMNVANEAGGLIYSTSAGGVVMGRGADYLILDDPNCTKEPESDVQRQTLHNWYDVSWSTRANTLAEVRELIIQQRTHTEDVTGHALKSGNWRHVKIPMEFEPDHRAEGDPRTAKGAIMDPIRFPALELEPLKIKLGPYSWAGLYQQEPYPLGGGIIRKEWLGTWSASDRQPGHIMIANGLYHFDIWRAWRFCTVDLAMTEKTIGAKKVNDPDYTVMAAWVVLSTPQGSQLVLLDLIRERQLGPETLEKLVAFHDHWTFSMIAVEDIAEKMWYQVAKKRGLPVREISTSSSPDVVYRIDRDKVARAVSATPLMAAGLFHIPAYAPWLSDYVGELLAFPNAAHDDCVDVTSAACAIAMKYSREGGMYGRPEPVPATQERDRHVDEPHDPWKDMMQENLDWPA